MPKTAPEKNRGKIQYRVIKMSIHLNDFFRKRGPPLPPEGTVARAVLHNIASLDGLSDNDVNLHNLNGYSNGYNTNSAILMADTVYQKLLEAQNSYYVSNARHRIEWRTMTKNKYAQLEAASVDDIANENIRIWQEREFLAKRKAKLRYSKRVQ